MFQFREDIKEYLNECFSNDTSLTPSKRPKIYNGYQIGHEPSSKFPEIQVQPLNASERVNYTTFCGKNANSLPLQVAVYSGPVKIGGIDYSSQDASVIIAEKAEKYLYDYIYANGNNNIYEGRLVGASPALPMNESGSVYVTVLRFDFVVAYPYEVGQTS